jgi:hypothetical protein
VSGISQPPSRLAAKLGHLDNVRSVEPRPDSNDRAKIRVVNSGIGHREISVIRAYGYEISAISMRHNYVSVKGAASDD